MEEYVQDVKGGKNFDANNEDISNVERDFKKYADISIRETSGEFKDFSIVIDSLSKKWNTLSEVEQSATAKALAGTRQRENFLILMNNMDTALKLQSAQLDSSGSSMTRYGEFAKSTEAKLNDLTNAVQKIWLNLLSSDFINDTIEGMTKFVNVIDSVTSTFGGLTTAIYITVAALAIFKSQAIAGVISGVSQWVISFGLAETASLGLSMGIKALSTAVLGLIANPIFLAIAAVGALTYAFVSYANHQQKVKEQLEATGKAQTDFTKSLEDFQNTLDPKKIDDMATSLENLKKSTDYDETIKKIQKLKDEIAGLENAKKIEPAMKISSNVEAKTKEIETLTASLKPYTDAQAKFNEQQKISTTLDYESVQAGNKKIALKIRENESNKQLIDSYQKVHDKIAQGNELTKEEANLNQKMIDKYPEYTKVLNDKTTAVGIDIEALKLNQTAEEALAIVSFNAMKTKAESSALATKQIIADTEARIHAIQAEIDALQGKNEAMGSANANVQYQKLLEQGSAQTFMEFKNGTIFNDTITPKLKIDLSGAWGQLQTAKQTLGAWNTLSGMSMDDLKKSASNGSGSSFDPPNTGSSPKEKASPTSSIAEQVSIEESLIRSFNTQAEMTAEQGKLLEKQIATAKSANDYNLQLSLTNDLIKNQKLQITQLGEAKSKIEAEFVKVSTQSGFQNTSQFVDAQGEVTLYYQNLWNASSVETQKQLSATFDKLSKLQKAWKDNSTSVLELADSQKSLQQSLLDIKGEIADQTIQTLKDSLKKQEELTLASIETEQTALETSHQKKLDILDEEATAYEDSINKQIDAIDKLSSAEDYNKNLKKSQSEAQGIQNQINILSKDTSISGKSKLADLQKQLAEKNSSIDDMQTDHTNTLRKQNLQDQLADYKKDIDAKKKAENTKYDLKKSELDAEKVATETTFNELMNNERYWAEQRLLIINGNIDAIKLSLAAFYEEFTKDITGKADLIKGSFEEIKNIIDDIKNSAGNLDGINMSMSTSDSMGSAYSGALTPSWGSGGKSMIVHQNELILNATETSKFFKIADILSKIDVPNILKSISLPTLNIPSFQMPQLANNITTSTVNNLNPVFNLTIPSGTSKNQAKEIVKLVYADLVKMIKK